jgi:hypothetical protein
MPNAGTARWMLRAALASDGDLAITGYGKLTASEIVEKLAHLSQVDLAKIDSYERKNDNRTTILSRITSLRGDEPWPGYDELSVDEIALCSTRATRTGSSACAPTSVHTRTEPVSSMPRSASSPGHRRFYRTRHAGTPT